MFDDRLQMFLGGVAVALARLRHDIAYVDAQRSRLPQRLGHRFDQQVGNDRRVKRARTDENEVGGVQRLDGAVGRLRVRGIDGEVRDTRVVRTFRTFLAEVGAADGDFAEKRRTVGECRAQTNVGERRWINLAGDVEDLRCGEDCLVKAAGNVGQRCNKKITQRMPAER